MAHTRIIPSGGNPKPKLFIIGERPGFEEFREGRPFVGPAGEELWERLRRVCDIERDDCYVANLVRTFSREPPTDEEIADHWDVLMADLARVRPKVIMTVGYHAARALLPQFKGVNGDTFHGMPFPYHQGPVSALLVPVVHSSAALRQPDRYQSQLTSDVRMVARVLAGDVGGGDFTRPTPLHVGLASLLAEGSDAVLGLDTEGSLGRPWVAEAVSLSIHRRRAGLVEPARTPLALQHVQTIIDNASRITIHHAKHDWKVLLQLGLTLPPRRVDDTMVMAYLLRLPQGLKELARRELGWEMEDYESLVLPLDETQVKQTLETAYARQSAAWETFADAVKAHQADARRRRGATRGPSRRHPVELEAAPPQFPKRAVTSLRGMLTKTAETSLRDRWEASTFAAHVPLPPVPTWQDLPRGVREPYALTDALAHRALRNRLWPRLEAEGLTEAYRVDMAVLPFLIRNEIVGLACSRKNLERLSAEFKTQFAQTCEEINDLAGYEVNPCSGEQVSECLFKELGVTPTRRTKSGKHHTTADKYLKARKNEHAIIPKILTARQLNKYIGTYTEKLPGLLQDGRYYPEWKYTRTATGRLAEVVILLIPKHDPLAKKEGRRNRAKQIRNCFHAGKGNVLVSVDLSQIELRVMAHLAQDPLLLDVFKRGEDPHADTAHRLLGAPRAKKDQDDSAHRLPAKTVNFGIINGMTEYGMLDQLHEAGQLQWTIEQVQELLDGWWGTYTRVGSYWDAQIEHGLEHGWIRETLFGRRREVSALWSTDDRIYAEAKRQCLFGIQSAADSISKVWNAALWREVIRPRQRAGVYCEPWIRVHDDTTLEVAESEAEAVMAEMLGLVPQLLDIPTPAEGKMGERWGDIA